MPGKPLMPKGTSRREERPTVSNDAGESKEVRTEKHPRGFDMEGWVALGVILVDK